MGEDGKTILHVEDDPNDVWLVKHAFQSANITNPLRIVNDGQEAVDYLKGNGKFASINRFSQLPECRMGAS